MKTQEEIQEEIDTLPRLQVTGARIPASIAEAVLAVQMSLGTLGKEDRNNFQNYNFVSIDKYYEVVARAATQQGLSWFCQETSSEIVNFGKDKGAIRFEFAFTMFHISGQVVPCYDRISIYHPLQGAQTSGSAASYAEKLFMRKAFKVVTGEDDADAVDQSFAIDIDGTIDVVDTKDIATEPEGDNPLPGNVQRSQEPAPESGLEDNPGPETGGGGPSAEEPPAAALNPEDFIETPKSDDEVAILRAIKEPSSTDWNTISKIFETFMPDSFEKTKEFWKSNTKAIEMMKEHDPKTHTRLVAIFKDNQEKTTTKGN